jgi:hypothetical protein
MLPLYVCWLLAAGCWLLAAGCWLLAAGCWLLAAGCWLPGVLLLYVMPSTAVNVATILHSSTLIQAIYIIVTTTIERRELAFVRLFHSIAQHPIAPKRHGHSTT